ncbi:Ldh family oxidoreductase [Caenimonas koreensis]|uniref:Ldh family oxidoreductase n=1 Tax=Caenimonas koreensis DSM 17982 TaxID=1121255 RepID=A0A844B4Q7_9BURK|nr:Ldh family oxidoreductase [Caenimonas koreensis]MRD46266.1 Ldh family oxidoreductase [Caenimonas koreensis DSM 17982]
MPVLGFDEAVQLAYAQLHKAGASHDMAASTARALVLAEAQGISSHGLVRVQQYCVHLLNGRVKGDAEPSLLRRKGTAVLVDAKQGLAFPACDFAVQEAIGMARDTGICIAAVTNSHHAGVLVDHLRPAGAAGFVGLAFANSPAAMPAAGGRHAMFGTNPIAAIFPRRSDDPLLIDLALSEVARGKVMAAARDGRAIPQGWALDKDGNPTTDPWLAMEGSMLPMGAATSSKGAMLALIVELLVTTLTGANFGFEASSFFVDEGNAPRIGQAFILIDPASLAGPAVYYERMETVIAEMLSDDGVRLAGARRLALERKARAEGLAISDALYAQLRL